MKPLIFKIRSRSARDDRAAGSTHNDRPDTLGRGMDIALSLAVFITLGFFLDRWLGTAPVFTITLTLLSAVGQFIVMKHNYDAEMERLEEELRADRRRAREISMGDAA